MCIVFHYHQQCSKAPCFKLSIRFTLSLQNWDAIIFTWNRIASIPELCFSTKVSLIRHRITLHCKTGITSHRRSQQYSGYYIEERISRIRLSLEDKVEWDIFKMTISTLNSYSIANSKLTANSQITAICKPPQIAIPPQIARPPQEARRPQIKRSPQIAKHTRASILETKHVQVIVVEMSYFTRKYHMFKEKVYTFRMAYP